MRTRWILFFTLVVPVWKLWRVQTCLLSLSVYLGTSILVCSVSYWLSTLMWSRLFMRLIDSDGKAVLVTGCASGFGNVLVKRLAHDGFLVYAGCRDSSSKGARELAKVPKVHVLQMDVTKEEELHDALTTVKSTIGRNVLWAVVANAGVPAHGLVEWESMETMRKVFDVNVFGVVSVCKKFLPLLRKSRGRLVLVSSVAGRGTFPYGVSYSMSKHAVTSLADGLRRECVDKGVDVATIEPSTYRTKIIRDVGSMEHIQKELDLLPREVRDEYSEEEISFCMTATGTLMKLLYRENFQVVIDQMVLAIRESEPKPYYSAWEGMDPIVFTVLRDMPAEFVDAIIFITRRLSAWGK
ncbi:17-beta-hydroxysteroid dehydrogenase type 6-like [Haemaphysalis longicornis]